MASTQPCAATDIAGDVKIVISSLLHGAQRVRQWVTLLCHKFDTDSESDPGLPSRDDEQNTNARFFGAGGQTQGEALRKALGLV
jgi:hypothetical protein